MSELKITVEEIKDLMTQMAQTGLGQVVVEDGDFKLKLSSQKESMMYTSGATAEMQPQISIVSQAQAGPVVPAQEPEEDEGIVVKSPIVGTFYSSPAPDKAAFVTVGQTVKPGDVLFIIESMKLMNEIQCEVSGQVTKVLVKDGEAVEFDQPILVIR